METGKTYSGFTVTDIRPLAELDARMVRMVHDKSGARLTWLDRKDENKTFAIAFRTVPEDDTGVFHILEHSVLCGSDRYPVKEPFVELMKSSLNTFLNAFTYPDKTMYPVSSRNDKDFINLVRVYMDAVLHPAIYHKPEIFRQEGWHYELTAEQSEPVYKGVVFNEMKGAYAEPDSRLVFEINRRLFPDNSYRFESGGHPAHIPELTYEQFLRAHQRFYAPSNSYIYLDGQMDLEAILAILDGEYLSAYTRRDDQPQFVFQKPVKSALTRVCYEISPDEPKENKARLAWGCVLGGYDCWEEQMAVRALADALRGGSESPLKRRLLSAGLAQDVQIQLMDEMLQPYVLLEIVNMDEGKVDEVTDAVRSELERLVREGLDHEQLAATLANLEFQLRERDFGGMPQGLAFGMNVMSSWLYGGDPAAALAVGELFASLNEKLEQGWFEALLERVFLKNDHCCQVLLVPSATLGEEEREAESARLKAARDSWSEADEAALRAQQEALDAWQASSDTPEQLATLPVLHLSDIPAKPEEIPLEEGELEGIPLLRHALPTGGIGYVNLYFDISDFTPEEISCVSLMSLLLGKLDTQAHDGAQLQKLLRSRMGTLRFPVEASGRVNEPEQCKVYLCASFSAVEAKLESAASLAAEIITGTRFDDTQRVLEHLRQFALQAEESVAGAGHIFALTRVAAGLSAEGAVREYAGGISYCQWLKKLAREFEDRAAGLTESLQTLCRRAFTAGRLTISVTGAEDRSCKALETELLPRLPVSERRELSCAVRSWGVKREGIVIPADISFAGLGGNLLNYGLSYSGQTRVASRVVSLAYLWNVIRVQGGAYGTGLSLNDSANACFYSYRDPGAARSLNSYRQTADFLRQMAAEKPDLTGLIIGAIAESEPLLLPGRKGRAADSLYLKGVTYADRCRRREEILSATAEDLAALAEPLARLSEEGGICVIGSRKQIADCGKELDSVVTL